MFLLYKKIYMGLQQMEFSIRASEFVVARINKACVMKLEHTIKKYER